MRWESVLIPPGRLLKLALDTPGRSWESVLIPPGRLPDLVTHTPTVLGISSDSPR